MSVSEDAVRLPIRAPSIPAHSAITDVLSSPFDTEENAAQFLYARDELELEIV